MFLFIFWAVKYHINLICSNLTFLEESNETQVSKGERGTQQSWSSGAATRTGETTHS